MKDSLLIVDRASLHEPQALARADFRRARSSHYSVIRAG